MDKYLNPLIKKFKENKDAGIAVWQKKYMKSKFEFLGLKTPVRKELMFRYILKVNDSDEFFVQKAIGWILRQYSKFNPEEVIEFVNKTKLAPLSKREALKVINK